MWTTIWISWGVLSVIALAAPEAKSVPVVPSFNQGTLKSTTTTKQKVNEVINSYQYRTGYEYTVSGTNIEPVGGNLAPADLTITSAALLTPSVGLLELCVRRRHLKTSDAA